MYFYETVRAWASLDNLLGRGVKNSDFRIEIEMYDADNV